MPKATRKRERMRQIANCLRVRYPTKYRVILRQFTHRKIEACDKDTAGACYLRGRTIYIDLDARLPWYVLVDFLIHEWAHALLVTEGNTGHDDDFHLTQGKIWTWFHDEEGMSEANRYPY